MIQYAEILIINDMPDQIALLSNLLGAEGFRVFAATSGKAARRFLERRVPHLILLDIQMGDVSGLEICRRVKASERAKDVPIVFLTSETSIASISQCFELGASDYINKPFAKDELLARIRTHLRVAIQRKELVAANEELKQFCSAVTHDLKAPFTIINMLIGMLQAELDEGNYDKMPEIMNMITMKSANAKIMIERLFDFSRMCNVTAKITEVDIKSVVKETYDELKSLCPERNIKLVCSDLPTIIADETLVRMEMKNLLQNAIKYTSKKERAMIKVRAEHNSSYYVIKVKDNGAGFDMQYVSKIFQVFERLHDESEFQGTGVGLALVNRIMIRHNGWIEAYGEVNKGAEFTLYFPKNVRINTGS